MAEASKAVKLFVSLAKLRHCLPMRLVTHMALGFLALAGCTPLSIYYKPGVSVTRLETDTTNCQVDALAEVPVNTQIRREPPVLVPGRVYCDANGNCYDTGSYWVPGRVYTVDVNEGLRQRVTDQCMAAKGYAPARIPQCPVGTADKVPAQATTQIPVLTDTSCVIKYNSGAFQIVNLE